MAVSTPPSFLRCFLCDIPATVECQLLLSDRQIRTSNGIVAGDSLDHVKKDSQSTKFRLMLRILGTVVDTRQNHLSTLDKTTIVNTIVLDDGSGLLATIEAPPAMTEQIHVQCGLTLDCVVHVRILKGTNNVLSSAFVLEADQLVVLDDPHAEIVRWLELTYRKKNTIPAQQGYPCRSFSADDLYNVILSCAHDNEANENNYPSGVTLNDLSECLDLPMTIVEGLIEELQMSCQIYRDSAGRYLPL